MPGGRTAARVSYDVLENGQVFQLPPLWAPSNEQLGLSACGAILKTIG